MLASIERADYLPAVIVIVAGNGNDSDARVIDQVISARATSGLGKMLRHALDFDCVHVTQCYYTAIRVAGKGSRVLLAHAESDHAHSEECTRHGESLGVAVARQRSYAATQAR